MKLIKFENEKIPEISKKVEKFDNNLSQVVKSMFDAIHKHDGIGLAAIQIGVAKRIIIAEIDDKKLIAVNPEILWKSEEYSEMIEGNLSLSKDTRVLVRRPSKIKIKYQDLRGNWNELITDGLLATCIQHEMEQMDGITILDHKK